MANVGHITIIEHGANHWNQWRNSEPNVRPDLRGADLRDLKLSGVNLSRSDLRRTDFTRTTLSKANLYHADLSGADLRKANLRQANLTTTGITGVDFVGTELARCNFTGARIGWTTFADVDLSSAIGLDTLRHSGPSTVGIDTLYRSNGEISEYFLKEAGVPEETIVYVSSLVGRAIVYYTCFISYSAQDEDFAKRLYNDLQGKKVRCWFAPEDMKIGAGIRPSIDQAIRVHDKLLLVLSNHSIASHWVEKEVETAFEQEAIQDKLVLFPIRLDDAVMETGEPWAADIRRQKHIGDFTQWKNHDAYQMAFERLLRDLKAGKQVNMANEEILQFLGRGSQRGMSGGRPAPKPYQILVDMISKI